MVHRLAAPRKALFFWLCLLPSLVLYMVARPQDDPATILAWPLATAVIIVAVTLKVASRPFLPLSEAGCWAVLTAGIYSIVPLAVSTALRGAFTPLNDSRLFSLQPPPAFVARVGWYHVAYLAALSAGYLLGRRNTSAVTLRPPLLDRRTAIALLLCFGVSAVVVVLFRPDSPDAGYAASYLAVQQLPLIARQALRLLGGVRLLLGLAVLVWTFERWRQRRVAVGLTVLALAILTVTRAGERSTLGFAIIACVVLSHRYVKPVRASRFFMLGVVGLLLFTALGVYRAYAGLDNRAEFTLVPGAGEFEIVFANAVDLLDRRQHGGFVAAPVGVHVADLVSVIPSQLLPFKKWDTADWFLSTYYPALRERGGGLAFGVVSQSVIGFGWVELLLRGLAMGLIFTAVDRWASARSHRFWPTVTQLWVLLLAYQTVRVTSLFPLGAYLQQMPTAFLLVWSTTQLLAFRAYSRSPSAARALRPAEDVLSPE